MIKRIIGMAVVGLAAAGASQAYTVAYGASYGHSGSSDPSTPLSSFDAALEARDLLFGTGTAAVQNFETIAAGTSGPLSLNFGSGDSSVTATLSGAAGRVVEVATGSTDEGRYSVAASGSMGNRFWETRATSTGATFELWFDNPVVKFGFFGIDVGDFGGVLELEILAGTAASNTVIATLTPGSVGVLGTPPITGTAADGSVLYFGVAASETDSAEWFRGVRFRSFMPGGASTSDDMFAFDSFTVVAAPRGTVPAPGTLALLGAALVGLSLARRR